jgi:hypothetical protein
MASHMMQHGCKGINLVDGIRTPEEHRNIFIVSSRLAAAP